MRPSNIGIFLASTALLTACGQPPPVNPVSNPQPPSLVAVSSVVNVIKCELNATFKNNADLQKLIGAKKGHPGTIDGKLHLENVVVDTTTGTGGLSIGSAIKIGPSGTYARKNTNTQTVDVEFSLEVDPSQPAPSQCTANSDGKPVEIKGHPFVALLQALGAEYRKINPGSPKIKLGKLDYTSQFDVETDASGGVTLDFLIFSAGITQEQDRTTTQALELDFNLDLAATLYGY